MRGLVVALTLAVVGPLMALSRRSGAPPSSTGAFITSTLREATCSRASCHEGAGDNTGRGRILIEANDHYVPDQPLDISVRVEEDGRERFGFQIAIKAASDTEDFFEHVGQIVLDDTARTQIVGDYYATHTRGGTDYGEWTLQWIPDPTERRPVTVFAAGNAADNSSSPSGDHIYTASRTLTSVFAMAAETDSRASNPVTGLRAYPNPFVNATTVAFTLGEAAQVRVSLFDIQGRRVRSIPLGTRTAGTHKTTLGSEGLAPGLYLYEILTPGARHVRPVVHIR